MRSFLHHVSCALVLVLASYGAWAQPTANFSASPLNGCAPKLVNFTDLSTGNPTSWYWDLGNGTTSTNQNPSTTYFLPGNYTITLTVSNSAGTNTKTVTNYISIYAPPTVNFIGIDSTPNCAPKTVSFTNLTTANAPGAVSYLWDFGDGNTSTATNPTHTYTTQGSFSVTLTATNSSGCTKSFTKPNYITTYLKPTASFTANPLAFCNVPATVNFTNTTQNAVTYFWQFGDGGTSTLANPSHTYANPGTYTVTLYAYNPVPCADTEVVTSMITITPTTSSFSFTNNHQCPGAVLSFTSSVAPSGGTYSWNFGDGGTSSLPNPTHSYANSGTYTVTLTYTVNGCAHTSTQTVTVLPKPVAAFTANNTVGCIVPHTVTFTNTSSGGVTYSWLFGDGGSSTATSPTHTYTALGSYTVTLIATAANGCSDTLVMPNYINLAPSTATITPSVYGGCAPLSVTFSASAAPYTIATYNWNLGNSTTSTSANPTATYTAIGSYTITLNYVTTTGCTGTASVVVTTYPTPVAAFTANPTNVCTNQPVNFTNNSTGATTYYWTFGDGGTSTATNPSHSYNTAGTYTVTLWAINGLCSTSTTQTITVTGPIANFTYTVSCTNRLQVTFTNTSTPGNYLWNFGDATTSTATSPVKTYAAYGTYNVMLTVTDPITGCQSFANQTIQLFPLQNGFTANDTNICNGETVTFTAAQSVGIANLKWDFGDGSPVVNTTANPIAHVYTTSGTYTVKLVITDIYGCKDSLQKLNYVKVGGGVPNFSGTPLTGCSPLTVSFTNLSTSTANPIASYYWEFGDGQFSSLANPTHTYQNAGTYSVTLWVIDNQGCSTAHAKPNYVSASKPNASFTVTPDTACLYTPVQFTNTSTGNGLTYVWNFGDNTTSSVANPTHVYTTVGSYVVTLIATDALGCKDTAILNVPIQIQQTIAAFVPSDTVANCPPLLVSFANSSINATTYLWNFGNGNTSTQTSPSTTYTIPGTYVVSLIASNTVSGCIDTFYKTIVVNGPIGTFTQSDTVGCVPLTINLVANATNVSQYVWDFDNGTTITTTAPNVSYTYTTPGIYVPRVILSDANACSYAYTGDTVRVDILQIGLSATPDTVCLGTPIAFNDTVLATGTPVISVLYNFGNSTTGTVNDPTYTYTTAGTYTVTVIMQNQTGCKDTVFKTVVVQPIPNVTIAGSNAICSGTSTVLTASGATSYSWSPATGLSCTNCASPTASPANTTTYTIIGIQANGCSDTATFTLTVNPTPVLTVVPPTDSICFGEVVPIAVTGATTYSWSPAATLSCNNCANPTASPITNTTYTVIGNNGNCADTATVAITVLPKPNLVLSNHTLCAGSSVSLSPGNADLYSWTPSAGLSCSTCAIPTATPLATTTYTVIGAFANGCADTATSVVTVNPLPVVSVTPATDTICLGSSTSLLASGANSFSWSPAATLSCNNCNNPNATPAIGTTTYTVIGNSNGCFDTATASVTVLDKPDLNLADKDICVGGSVLLTPGQAGTYLWSPPAGLSCTNCATPTASPTVTTTYTVIGSLGNGCSDTSSATVTVHPLPVVDAGPNQEICEGATATLTATGAQSFVWSPAATLSCTACLTTIASPLVSTLYQVVGTDNWGCMQSDTVRVSIVPHVPTAVGPGDSICKGESIQLSASGGVAYTWWPSQGLSNSNIANPIATPIESTLYKVAIKENDCYTDTYEVAVVVDITPEVSFNPSEIKVTAAQQITLQPNLVNVTNATTYRWSPATNLSCGDCAYPKLLAESDMTYRIIVRNEFGCADTADVTIKVNCTDLQLFMPNTFTPNGDGNNDWFYPMGVGIRIVKAFNIYNRWGELVFRRENFNANQEVLGWDGTFKNQVLPPDVYVYYIEAECTTGNFLSTKGDITIYR